jgi:S1-C subfamily serine protease
MNSALDEPVLDAYSWAVSTVAEQTSPSVVAIHAIDKGRARGSGSGFAFTPDGLILTNSHVIHRASRIRIETTQGDAVDAELIGEDAHTDTALLRARVDLAALPLGTSKRWKM